MIELKLGVTWVSKSVISSQFYVLVLHSAVKFVACVEDQNCEWLEICQPELETEFLYERDVEEAIGSVNFSVLLLFSDLHADSNCLCYFQYCVGLRRYDTRGQRVTISVIHKTCFLHVSVNSLLSKPRNFVSVCSFWVRDKPDRKWSSKRTVELNSSALVKCDPFWRSFSKCNGSSTPRVNG